MATSSRNTASKQEKKVPATPPTPRTTKHKLQESPDSRSQCIRCKKTIGKGEKRCGVDYDRGFRWWHQDCYNIYNHRYKLDPSGRAKCIKCETSITKGTWRVEKEEFYGPPQVGYRYQYYHSDCLTREEKEELNLKPKPPGTALFAQQQKPKPIKDENDPIRNALLKLRSEFAGRLSCQSFKVYSNKVIEELVKEMPKDEKELLAIDGIGKNKLKNFGSAILLVIKQHRYKNKPQKTTLLKFFESKGTKPPPTAKNDTSEDDVEVVKHLTEKEIVDQVFEDARNAGLVIQCD